MKKVGYFLLGIFCIGYGLEALITGDTTGFGGTASMRRIPINLIENPIEYVLSVLFWFGVGVVCIRASMVK